MNNIRAIFLGNRLCISLSNCHTQDDFQRLGIMGKPCQNNKNINPKICLLHNFKAISPTLDRCYEAQEKQMIYYVCELVYILLIYVSTRKGYFRSGFSLILRKSYVQPTV